MIVVETFKGMSVADHTVEIVERKGIGHPDTICDSIMESVSVALCREYKKRFGTVLHHNIDKGLLAAGRAEIVFGGGRVMKPMELSIGDRATFSASGESIPVMKIAVSAAREWIREHLRFVDPEKHLRYRVVLAPGSEELSDIFERNGAVKGANDTSALIGYYPLSPTEEVVLKLEQYLNSARFKKKFPDTGEDTKVMGLRTMETLDLTVAMPLISKFVKNEREYFQRKAMIQKEMARFLSQLKGFKKINVVYNNLDIPERGLGGIYLTVLGTSAESADSGQVGRGNRVNGLISVNRPLGTEAAAGKNPVSHVGKIYNILAHKIAEKIYKNVEEVKEVYVLLLSRIGLPIDTPHVATAQVLLEKGVTVRDIAKRVSYIVEAELAGIGSFCEKLASGRYPVC